MRLKAKKSNFKFSKTEAQRSFNQKGEITMAVGSTMNEYSNIHENINNSSQYEDHSFKNYMGVHDSFTKSVKTLFNSIKTDNFSRQSDQSIFQELKQIALVNNEAFINEKIGEMEQKLHTLKSDMG